MMRIHKEGQSTILVVMSVVTIFLVVILAFSLYNIWVLASFILLSVLLLVQTMMFFRIPSRNILIRDDGIVSPADGRIVMIQEVQVNEYLQEKRLQVSIFMNLFNVHVNWYPCGGDIVYYKYHPGDKMVAWHPKSSDKNEHTTLFVKQDNTLIGVRQIAGLMARRVVCKARTGKQVLQCSEMGIIKFGSRVDVLLPPDAEVKVRKGQRVWGCETLIATLKR
ncbi:MAG TPA: phosphatidylserine decarboxylase family protein [Bacteroidales bacterium]|jgi:phosphatidylserine decarboxylase|nr:phosphatidylserine decarboxylase family protein [Bacteroidales bacterium]NLZ08744.1 phosphatidylserine decarboxylase family protein [Bacteroidales bacterium]HNT47782.1 phosphatidylserine decarboxylase family protein [Bacteroidales bacterium]HOF75322.1 phosphatidylserine decarboxylase family protein [Bacteroidales bacterium]HOQ95832.1 phosphatidylserine decarboxylase family protein [Bacteroidales bacterium]